MDASYIYSLIVYLGYIEELMGTYFADMYSGLILCSVSLDIALPEMSQR